MHAMTPNCIHFSASSIKISPPPPSLPISPLHPTATPPSLLTRSVLPNLASNVCSSCLSLPVPGTIGMYTTNSCLLDVILISAHPLSQQPWVSLALLHAWDHRCWKSSGFFKAADLSSKSSSLRKARAVNQHALPSIKGPIKCGFFIVCI